MLGDLSTSEENLHKVYPSTGQSPPLKKSPDPSITSFVAFVRNVEFFQQIQTHFWNCRVSDWATQASDISDPSIQDDFHLRESMHRSVLGKRDFLSAPFSVQYCSTILFFCFLQFLMVAGSSLCLLAISLSFLTSSASFRIWNFFLIL